MIFRMPVSTHSRLKAAGLCSAAYGMARGCFNTQPPEGGWPMSTKAKISSRTVSTHSRLKAAGRVNSPFLSHPLVSTHSRLKAAGFSNPVLSYQHVVSTHSRLKAAGPISSPDRISQISFNTQPPEGGWTGDVGHTPFVNVSTHSRLKAAG